MNFFEQIHDFINENLSEVDLQLFESELEKNSALKEAVEDYKLESTLKDILFFGQAKAELDAIEISSNKVFNNDLSSNKSTNTIRKLFPKLAIAASFFVLVGAVFLFNQPSNPQDIFIENFDAYPSELIEIVRGGNDDNSLSQAFILYESGKFQEALIAFENETIDDLDFYRAICLSGLNQYSESNNLFSTIQSPTFSRQILWYQALNNFALNNFKDGKENLKDLVNLGPGFKFKQANQLLTEL